MSSLYSSAGLMDCVRVLWMGRVRRLQIRVWMRGGVGVHINIHMQKTGANENAVRAKKKEGESKHMENRLEYLRKQMGVSVGLGVWLRGGLVLACSLLERSNPFHSAEDGPRQFSTQIGQFLDLQLYGSKSKAKVFLLIVKLLRNTNNHF